MAFCVNCGTQMGDGVKFCSSCGNPAGGIAPATPKSVTEKVGNIRKCPACGAEVQAMTAICSSCGHEFSGVQANNAVQAFFEKLDAVSQSVFEAEAAAEVAKATKKPTGGAIGALLGLDDMAMPTIKETSAGAKRQIAMIESFPIPNAKEAVIEFVLLASSRYKGAKKPLPEFLSGVNLMRGGTNQKEEYELDNAWKTKCEQAYTKAKMTFGSDQNAIAEIEKLLKQKKIIK